MKALFSALIGAYTRWRYVEDVDTGGAASPKPAVEVPKDELVHLRTAIARERRNLESYIRFNCEALARPCQDSIRAMEGRIRALEMFTRRAV